MFNFKFEEFIPEKYKGVCTFGVASEGESNKLSHYPFTVEGITSDGMFYFYEKLDDCKIIYTKTIEYLIEDCLKVNKVKKCKVLFGPEQKYGTYKDVRPLYCFIETDSNTGLFKLLFESNLICLPDFT